MASRRSSSSAAVAPMVGRSGSIRGLRSSFVGAILLPMDTTLLDVRSALDPHSPFIKLWHQILLAAMLYQLFVIPFVGTFKPLAAPLETPEIVILYALEGLFVVEFAVKLNTGYYEDGGVLRDLRRARLKYLRSRHFVADALAVIPIGLIPIPLSASRMWLETHKILRFWRFPQLLSNLDDLYAKHFEELKIFKTIVSTLLLSHYLACIRFSFGYDDHHHDHWLPQISSHQITTQTKYLQALFWGFGVLSGFVEGELPQTVAAFVFTIVVAFCGFGVFTYLCGMFFMLSKCEVGHSEAAEARIHQLQQVLAFHQVPENIQAQAIEYLKRYSTDAESNDREAMKILCPSIAKDIQVELLRATVAIIPVFAGCSDHFVTALTGALEVMALPAHCVLFHAGDEGDAMYIIQSGVLDVIVGKTKVRELRKGDFVGELSLFSERPRSATVVTNTYCLLYQLSRYHTERVLEGYPASIPVIRKSVLNLIERAEHRNRAATESGVHMDSPSSISSRSVEAQSFRALRNRSQSVFSTQLLRMITHDSVRGILQYRRSVVKPITNEPDVQSAETRSPQNEHLDRGPRPSIRLAAGRLRRALTVRKQKGSAAIQVFHDQYAEALPQRHQVFWWSRIFLPKCIDADSRSRLWWICALQVSLLYNLVSIPLLLAFPLLQSKSWFLNTTNAIADVILFVDVYLNFNLSFTSNSEKIMDPSRCAKRYLRGQFVFDVLMAFPYALFTIGSDLHSFLRIPRLLRVLRIRGHLHEIDKQIHLKSKDKLMLLGTLLLLLCHLVACLYFSITYLEGYSQNYDAWIPTHDIELIPVNGTSFYVDYLNVTYSSTSSRVRWIAATQYFRSLYYATNILTGLGRTIEPDTDRQYAIALVFMFSGFIITAIVVDNVQKRFTASAYEQKEFFAMRTRIQLFLRRQKTPFAIFHRVNSFLDYWWSAHRGAFVEELIADLPVVYRREVLRSICQPALQSLALLAGVRPVLNELETEFVDHVGFLLYGQDELIYREGDTAMSVFFLLRGQVTLRSATSSTKHIPEGGFFGTRALRGGSERTAYTEDAAAASGCVLIRLTRQDAVKLKSVFPDLEIALQRLEQRLLDTKLARYSSDTIKSGQSHSSRFAVALLSPIDPDSRGIVAWETMLFIAMTLQWVLVIYHTAFGVDRDHFLTVDMVTVALELFFVADIYVRSRAGYHELGNKVMDIRRIRRRYFRSWGFAIDLFAILPFFVINWVVPVTRYEMFNMNKLCRLLKVPGQFKALEQRYLRRTTELRLFKLVYYSFLVMHICGCMYYDFASHLSRSNLSDPNLAQRKTEFGVNHWLLPVEVQEKSTSHRYFAALFWAFGLMSASQQGEIPKSSMQCLHSVVTMMTGFFLFAYVIGNFADITEMADAENREFNSRLGSMRHLISHFNLPATISEKLKTFVFFKRYHTITQEEQLEKCLPPSLVTDIRLLNLQPMINKVPFLGGMKESITRMLVSQFRQVLVVKDEYVYQLGDEGSDMYFVFTGNLAMLVHPVHKKVEVHGGKRVSITRPAILSDPDADPRTLKFLNKLTTGDFFGENALFTDRPRNSFVRATTSCILYQLSRHSLEMVFELFPDWKKQVLQTVKVQQKQHRLRSGPEHQTEPSAISSRDDTNEEELRQEEYLSPPSRIVREVEDTNRWHLRTLWLRRILKQGTTAQSRGHIAWLYLTVSCTLFEAVLIPYRMSVDRMDRWSGVCVVVHFLELFCGAIFVLDIWFNWHIQESSVSIEYYEQNLLDAYKRERLVWDVVAAIPIDLALLTFPWASWLRLVRLCKMANFVHYLNEINRRSVSYELSRFCTIWLLYCIAMVWGACAYLGVTMHGNYGNVWNAWTPTAEIELDDPDNPSSHQILLRFFRGFFFAVTAFVKKGRTFVPETTSYIVFAIVVCYFGLFVMAFMIGEIASLYISSIGNQVNFRKQHISLELYLDRYRVSNALRKRVQGYLSTLWSSQLGVNYERVLSEMPKHMRIDTVMHVAAPPLATFIDEVFRPLMPGDSAGCRQVIRSLAEHLQFEGYPRGENVVVEGMISNSMYFVVHGHLLASSSSHPELFPPLRLKRGHYFGEKGLIALSVSQFTVRTLKACDLFSISSDALIRAIRSHEFLSIAMRAADEIIGELRQETADGSLPLDRSIWKAAMRRTLERHRLEWLSISTLSVAAQNDPDTRKSIASAQMSKAATQWSALLIDILDSDSLDGGLSRFRHLFTLLAPHGIIYPNDTPQDHVPPSQSTLPVKENAHVFRDLVTKITRMDIKGSTTSKGRKLSTTSM